MKVDYRTIDGAMSTAYLDTEIAPHVWVGTDKHTDDPVTCKWTLGDGWQEISRKAG